MIIDVLSHDFASSARGTCPERHVPRADFQKRLCVRLKGQRQDGIYGIMRKVKTQGKSVAYEDCRDDGHNGLCGMGAAVVSIVQSPFITAGKTRK